MKRTWRRRNYFIKKELQGKYVFSFFIFVIAGSFFYTVIFSLLSADTLTIAYKDYNLSLGKTPIILLAELLRAYWIFIVTGGLLAVFVSVFLTHRFAGPLFRFEKTLEKMIGGDFNLEIRLRTKDEAKEVAQLLNQFNNQISSNLRELRSLSDEIDVHLSGPSKTADRKITDEDMEKVMDLNRRLCEILHSFKLKNDE